MNVMARPINFKGCAYSTVLSEGTTKDVSFLFSYVPYSIHEELTVHYQVNSDTHMRTQTHHVQGKTAI